MTAEAIATALGGHRVGTGWMARCPAHQDRRPSLSIADAPDGKVLVHCFTGCNQRDVIDALKRRGLWPQQDRSPLGRGITSEAKAESVRRTVEPSVPAHTIWNSAEIANGTPVETYLASRGLILPADAPIRFHPSLRHPTGVILPAMVSLVADGETGIPLAIHRTFLATDGRGKADVDPNRMMLGPCGGGAVRLAEPIDLLMVGEGIETCLSAMAVMAHPVWAALSTSGLRTLALPATVRDVIVLADGDDAGEAAARDSAMRWKREGRRVRIVRPPRDYDFNDLLMQRRASTGAKSR